jgi:hypothetical protein
VNALAATPATAALVAAPLKATLTAPGHAPKVNTKWRYTLRVTSGGRPAAAKLTAQIVDPIGGMHPVDLGVTKKPITNYPIKGTFRDFIIWPRSSDGIPLTLRFVVRAGGKTTTIRYRVVAHA